jgi:hypothetical protein
LAESPIKVRFGSFGFCGLKTGFDGRSSVAWPVSFCISLKVPNVRPASLEKSSGAGDDCCGKPTLPGNYSRRLDVLHVSGCVPLLSLSTLTRFRLPPAQALAREYHEVERIFREDLGGPPEQFFAEFSNEPIAAASLAQVPFNDFKC